jgi:hypothetical protein
MPQAGKGEREDYHFTLDLSKKMRHEDQNLPLPPPAATHSAWKTPSGQISGRGRGRPLGSGGVSRSSGTEKGRVKLSFGRQA